MPLVCSRKLHVPGKITRTGLPNALGQMKRIQGKREVTTKAALDLAEAPGTCAKPWMNVQARWALDRARKKRAA